MLARAISRSLVRSIAIPRHCPARPAKSLLLGLPHLQQSRNFAIKRRRPYTGGDPSKDVSPEEAEPITPTDATTSPPSQAEPTTFGPPIEGWQTSTTSSAPPPPPPGTDPNLDPAASLFIRKATPATGGGGKGGDGLPKSAYVSSTDRKRERLARLMFASFIAAVIGAGIYLGRNLDEFEKTVYDPTTVPNGWSISAFQARLKARVRNVLDFYNEPPFEKLLPDPHPDYYRPYTLVIGLEDLCVHATWDREHGWRIAKRPGLDYFLAYLFNYYEIVVFTNQHDQIAAPIIAKMDQYPGYIMYPLFRSHTRYKDGKYIKVCLYSPFSEIHTNLVLKDLNYLNRDLSKVIMLETNPDAWSMNPSNTIKMRPWTGDPNDKELVSLIPFLEYIVAMGIADVRPVIDNFGDNHIPTEFARREALARAELKKRLEKERAQKKGTLGELLLGALGLGTPKKKKEDEEKTFMDLARERGVQQYMETQKHIAEHREEMMKEQKNFEREQAEQMKTSLSKIFTEVRFS